MRLLFSLSLIAVFALLLAGCTQPSAPQASASATPSVQATVQEQCVFKDGACCKASECKTVDQACPEGNYALEATGECTVNCVAEVRCVALPSPSVEASPSVLPGKNNLTQMRDLIDVALRESFGTTPAWFSTTDEKVFSATSSDSKFNYELFVQRSITNAWSGFDTITQRTGLVSNRTKTLSLSIDEAAIGAKAFDAKMECYDWTYVITYKVKEFIPDSNLPQHEYAENLTSRLIDLCP
ncbi:MAG: hypothetical protein V1811_03360 [Candidatus Micrarchaeota archaeon]